MTRPSRLAPARTQFRPTIDRLEGRALMATAGQLDPTFASRGFYNSAAIDTSIQDGLTAVAIGSDGTIFAAGSVSPPGTPTLGVISLNPSGQPNSNFGTDGEATIPVPTGTTTANLSVVALTSSGQIVVAGTISSSPVTESSTQVIVARFNTNGTLDTTFGTGGEVIIGSSGLAVDGTTFTPAVDAGDGANNPNSVAVQPDGSVVLAGEVPPATTGGLTQAAVVRLDPQGTVDTTFGTGGLVVLPGSQIYANTVSVAPNGQILAAGSAGYTTYPYPHYESDIDRLNADGSVSGSAITTDYVGIYKILPLVDGSLYAYSGYSDGQAEFYDELDHYGASGMAEGSLKNPPGSPIGVQPNGDVLLGGAGISRLTPSLIPDASFGINGTVLFTSNVSPTTLITGAIAPDGSIVGAGYTTVASPYNATLDAIVKLTSTPTPATPGDFTGNGISSPAVYLTGTGTFVIGSTTGGAGQVIQLGSSGQGNSIPAAGDYYGIGRDAPAVYIAQTGYWAIQDPTGQTPGLLFPFGQAGVGNTIPVQADYYGTGSDDVAIYLTQSATWDILQPGLAPGVSFPFGIAGAGNTIPVPGDYAGVGSDQVAVYLPATGTWSILGPGLNGTTSVHFGIPGTGNSIPVPGDYDGSGHTELAVFIPRLSEFQYINGQGQVVTVPLTGANGGPLPAAQAAQVVPTSGDYSGGGVTDFGAYLAATNEFAYVEPTTSPLLGHYVQQTFTVGFTDQGPIVPVTSVVPLSLLASGSGSIDAIEAPGVMGQADDLDFLIPLVSDAKKAKPGETSAN